MACVLPVVALLKVSASRLGEAPDASPLLRLLGNTSLLPGLLFGIALVNWRSAA